MNRKSHLPAGPGAYSLEKNSNVGPAWTITKKHISNNDSEGPAPGDYSLESRGNGPAFTIPYSTEHNKVSNKAISNCG